MTWIWPSKDGPIPVSEMTDSHLQNAYKYIRKKRLDLEEAEPSLYGYVGGEMASYHVEQMQDEVAEQIFACRGWEDIFREEMLRREVTIPWERSDDPIRDVLNNPHLLEVEQL